MLSQPRCIKRVKAFYDDGFECHVYGYDRGKYDINVYPEGVKVFNLGIVRDREYFHKIIKTIKNIWNITRQYKQNHVIYYAFGFLQAMLLRLLGRRYIYEISDILYAYPRFRYVLPLIKKIDKGLIRKSFITTMTSGGFYKFYGLKESNIIILPNKVSTILNREAVQPIRQPLDHLSFGFVGSIRYATVFRFAEVIGHYYPQHSFHFWGGTNPNLQSLLNKEYRNVFWHGLFKNPSDLPSIYQSIDVVVACYETKSLNERLAEPNKLYEALFFCKPIIVSDGIYLSERVKELKCGFCIDASTVEQIKVFIDRLNVLDINKISEHEYLLPLEESVHDQKELNERVRGYFKDVFLL